MLLLVHDHDCEVNWVTVRSVHRLFRVSPIIFLYYGSECSYCLLSFQRHRLLGDLSYVHRCWIWLFFQAPPALLLEPWANQLAPLYRDSSQITGQSATFSQELFWSVRWLSGQGCLLPTWQPEVNPWDPHGRRRETCLTSCLLSSTLVLYYMYTHIQMFF